MKYIRIVVGEVNTIGFEDSKARSRLPHVLATQELVWVLDFIHKEIDPSTALKASMACTSSGFRLMLMLSQVCESFTRAECSELLVRASEQRILP